MKTQGRWLGMVFSLVLIQVAWVEQAASESLSFNLRNDAARLEFMAPLGSGDLAYTASLLHHEDDGDYATLGLELVQKMDKHSYVGLGLALMAFDVEEGDGAGLGVGGFVRYAFPTMPALAFGGQLYYSPDVIAFDDVDRIWEAALRLELRVMDQADVYVGYRRVNVDFEPQGEANIDEGGHLGFRFYF
ncbi:MAG: hypothetical protein COB51_14025 [Moraxellaceae bacterium]|nr:MAG: hypothetical protein COB51_14025 [Moraxellaceae bacterium]